MTLTIPKLQTIHMRQAAREIRLTTPGCTYTRGGANVVELLTDGADLIDSLQGEMRRMCMGELRGERADVEHPNVAEAATDYDTSEAQGRES